MLESEMGMLAVFAVVLTVATLIEMYLWWEGKIFDFPWLLRAYIVYAAVVPGMWAMTQMMAPDLGISVESVRPYFVYGSIAVLAGGLLLDLIGVLRGHHRVPPPFG